MANETVTFEQALARLEKIVEQLEQGKIGLEDSVKHYEEGMGLIDLCRKTLAQAEMKIQQLQAAGERGVSTTDPGPIA